MSHLSPLSPSFGLASDTAARDYGLEEEDDEEAEVPIGEVGEQVEGEDSEADEDDEEDDDVDVDELDDDVDGDFDGDGDLDGQGELDGDYGAGEDATSAAAVGQVQKRSDRDESMMHRRRRDVRAARDRLGEQFELLRRVLPEPAAGVELTVKAQVLEHSVEVIQRLMKRATDLAMELAVVTPEATRRWVRNSADDGRKPLVHSVSSVMKLFAARRRWRYAEWWTLDERRGSEEEEDDLDGVAREKPAGVVDDPGNVHGCVVRDSVSVMRLGWTLIQKRDIPDLNPAEADEAEEEALGRFARASSGFEFRPRVGMPGRVWTSRRAEWLVDLADRETFIRNALAEQFGMKTCLAVPIQFGGHVHSVMAFYAREVRGYNGECYDLACLLSQCLEEIYSPSGAAPWQVADDVLFPTTVR